MSENNNNTFKRAAAIVISSAAIASCLYAPASGAFSASQTTAEQDIAPEQESITEQPETEPSAGEEAPEQDPTEPSEPEIPPQPAESCFEFEATGDGAVITGYTGSETELFIPAELDGYTVTGIGEKAFSGHDEITSVGFPDTLTIIADEAFKGCTGLEKLSIPSGIKRIGSNAFGYCTSLADIELSEGVEELGAGAFTSTAITSIAIPSTLKTAEAPFRGCLSLEHFTFAEGVKTIPTGGNEDECCGLFAYCPGLTELVIPDGIEAVGNGAFRHCDALTKIEFPASLKEIGAYAFSECKKLKSVDIPANVKTVHAGCFSGCKALSEIKLNEGLEALGLKAFENAAISEIHIPSTLNCAEAPFYGCDRLKSIDFAEGLKTIPSASAETDDKYGLFAYCPALTDVTVPEGIEVISAGAFRACPLLAYVSIPDSLQVISSYAFADCPKLRDITGGSDELAYSLGSFINCPMFRDPELLLLDAEKSYVSCDSVTAQSGGAVSFTISYSFAKDISALTNARLTVTIPDGLEIIPETFRSTDDDITAESIQSGAVSPAKQEGKFSFSCRVRTNGEHKVTASAEFEHNLRKNRVSIGSVTVDARQLSLKTAAVTDEQSVKVYGIAGKGETFGIFVNGRPAKAVTADAQTGKYTANITLPKNDSGKYEIYAASGKIKSNTVTVICNQQAPVADRIEMSRNGIKTDITSAFTDGKAPVMISEGAFPIRFSVRVRSSDNAEKVLMTGSIGNETRFFELYRVGSSDTWTGEGFFFPLDGGCMPETMNVKIIPMEGILQPTVEIVPVETKEKTSEGGSAPEVTEPETGVKTVITEPALTEYTQFTDGARIRFTADSTGFVYEGLTSQRVSGATLTIYTTDADTGEQIPWDPEGYDLNASVTSGSNGEYYLLLPEGRWKIVCEKEGYDRSESDWIESPRAADEIMLSMVSRRAPKPDFAELSEDKVTLRFSELMDVSTVTPATVLIDSAEGYTIRPEYAAEGDVFTDTFIIEGAALEIGDKVRITDGCLSYSGTAAGSSEVEARSAVDYVLGDVNRDGKIDSSDATAILAAYSMLSTGGSTGLSPSEELAADVRKDGKINSSDASLVLAYYSYLSTGGKKPLEDVLGEL